MSNDKLISFRVNKGGLLTKVYIEFNSGLLSVKEAEKLAVDMVRAIKGCIGGEDEEGIM